MITFKIMTGLIHIWGFGCIFNIVLLTGGEKPKTAAVFGGGVAGLTAAMELKEAGFDVTLYEKEEDFGGKMRGYVDEKGYPREHSYRTYNHRYFALGDVLERAGLKPPKEFEENTPQFRWISTYHFGTSTGYSMTSAMDNVVKKMAELGVFPSEYKYLEFQMEALKQVPIHTINALYNVTFKDFIDTGFAFADWKNYTGCVEGTVSPTIYCLPEHSNDFHSFINSQMSLVTAAKPEDSAPAIMNALQYLLNKFPTPPQCKDYYRYFKNTNSGYLAAGPTSLIIVDPWKKYIQKIGVKLHPGNRLVRLNIASETNSITSASVKPKLGKKHDVRADVYVLALPVNDAEDVLPGITQGTYQSIRLAASIQFYLPCLPASFETFRNKTTIAAAFESEYEITFMLQSPYDGAWESSDIHMHRGIEYVLSVTFCDLFKPGRNGKSFLNSTWNDALSEILQQIYFPEMVTCQRSQKGFTYDHAYLIRTAKSGLLLEDVPDLIYQRKKNEKYKTALVGPRKPDGKRWILAAPLYLITPTSKPIPVCTEYDNLVLAGEYVATTLADIVTMEHSAESGKFAAQALVEKYGMNYTVPTIDQLLKLVNATMVKEYCEMVKVGTMKGYC